MANAAERLYERYHDRVFGYCLYRLGSREEAEDAVQNTFFYAFRGLRRGVVPEVESSWLLKIAQNVCLTRHRSRRRRGALEVLHDPQTLEEVSPVSQGSGDELLGLAQALALMPEQQRRAILLREWKGLSYREIAEEMELSGAAVETLIFRARRALAELLNGGVESKARRRLKHGFDFGSLLTALKSALAGSSAVKVAATVAALTTATLVAGRPLLHDREPATGSHRAGSVVTPQLTIVASVPPETREQAAVRRSARNPRTGPREPTQAGSAAVPAAEPAPPQPAPPPEWEEVAGAPPPQAAPQVDQPTHATEDARAAASPLPGAELEDAASLPGADELVVPLLLADDPSGLLPAPELAPPALPVEPSPELPPLSTDPAPPQLAAPDTSSLTSSVTASLP